MSTTVKELYFPAIKTVFWPLGEPIIGTLHLTVRQIDRTSTEQPTVQVTEQVHALLLALSNEQLSLKVLMEKVGLKHRPTFLENYISPASEAGFLKVLYPDKPNHPRQKYLLTAKGLALYNEIKKIQ